MGFSDSNSLDGIIRSNREYKEGGSTDKNWIQKAINPAHKGYCTPVQRRAHSWPWRAAALRSPCKCPEPRRQNRPGSG